MSWFNNGMVSNLIPTLIKISLQSQNTPRITCSGLCVFEDPQAPPSFVLHVFSLQAPAQDLYSPSS